MYSLEKATTKAKKAEKKMPSTTIQCFDYRKFLTSYAIGIVTGHLSTLSSAALNPTQVQSWFDIANPARWRINPLNLYAGFMNGIEECRTKSNYHTSSRHGAHNSLWNVKDRLLSDDQMWNHYGTGKIKSSDTTSRFNSEMWEYYSWKKGKECFENCAHNAGFIVKWTPSCSSPRRTWTAILKMDTKWFGSSVGISIAKERQNTITDTNYVKICINYKINEDEITASNGQMFPIDENTSPDRELTFPQRMNSSELTPLKKMNSRKRAKKFKKSSDKIYKVPYSLF